MLPFLAKVDHFIGVFILVSAVISFFVVGIKLFWGKYKHYELKQLKLTFKRLQVAYPEISF